MIASAALNDIRQSAAVEGSAVAYLVNKQQVTLKNGQSSTALTPADLVQAGYIQQNQEKLPNGQTPTIEVLNENGGLLISVVPGPLNNPSAYSLQNAKTALLSNPWMGEVAQDADAVTGNTLVALGGAFQGSYSQTGIAALPNAGYFVPVALQWLSSGSMVQEQPAQSTYSSRIASLKPGQTYTDSEGNTFTAYNSSQGVVIKTSVNVTGAYLWFPQSVFEKSNPSISGFYVPSGTGTGDTGEGPYSLQTSGQTVEGYWDGQHQANFPLSDFG